MASILTLDLGTTYFKCCRWSAAGDLLHLERAVTPVVQPQPGYAEIDPDALKQCLVELIAAVGAASGGLEDVAALSFATQTNSFVLLDENDAALTPVILWSDLRAAELVPSLRDIASEPGFHQQTGVPVLAAEFAVAKLCWLQQRQPQTLERMRRFCLLSDYLTLWLTGRHVTEAGAAGLTGLLDIHALRWLGAPAESVGLKEDALPEVVRAGTDLGPLASAVAHAVDLPQTCRFVVGCLDQYAGAIGVGNIRAGSVSETTGTVLATVRATQKVDAQRRPGVFFGPGHTEQLFYGMCFGSISGNLLEWYRTQLPDRPDFAKLSHEAGQVAPGADGLRVRRAPSLGAGEDVFGGVGERHTRGHFVRSIMERVALALHEQVAQLGGASDDAIRACGGAARSEVWLQIKADLLGHPVQATRCPEPTSLGAAMLAGRALGWGDLSALAERWVRLGPVLQPDADRHAAYARIIDAWLQAEG